ncbi:MAG: hypothetical protein HZC48_13460 [Nitrospirae bacterium]|nr:hypothetical protein [Nitrospirota bacterium]
MRWKPIKIYYPTGQDMGIANLGKDFSNSGNVVRFVAIFSFFLFFFISLLRMQPSNVDLWWHIATGKYIVENHSLPQKDPFLFTSSNTPSERKSIILKGYWLSQVFFYEVFSIGDMKGIILLRAIFLLGFLYFVFLTIKKQGVHDIVALLAVSGVFWYTLIAEGERPQLFTFFIFSVIYYLIEDYRRNRCWKVYLVPVLIMVLSNMHPGYIICFILLLMYLAGESIRYLFREVRRDNAVKGLFLISVLSFLFSYLNPNHWDVLVHLVSTSFFTKDTMNVVEMLPPFKLYSMKMIPVDYPYIIFLFLSLLSLLFIRKTGLVHMLLLIAFTLISMSAYRFLMFYLCVSAPVVARVSVFAKDKNACARLVGFLKAKEGLVYIIVSMTGVFLIITASVSLAGFRFQGNELFFLPKNAADFLSKVEIKGNMYNEYGFGGYLTWRLYPEKMAFIDTRSLEPDVTYEYRGVAFAIDRPYLSWRNIMKKYNISYVVTLPLWQNGKIMPIVEELLDSEDWALIYTDQLTLIFVKRDSGNSSVINRYEKEKEKGMNTIIAQASAWAMTPNQVNPNYFITLGKAFFKLGRFTDSEKAFLMAYDKDSENPETTGWLKKLREDKTSGMKGK